MKLMITLVGEARYAYHLPVIPGTRVKLVKESDNPVDNECISVYCDHDENSELKVDTCKAKMTKKFGYVANSVNSKANGTWSSGRIYDKLGDIAYAEVLYVKEGCIIAQVDIV